MPMLICAHIMEKIVFEGRNVMSKIQNGHFEDVTSSIAFTTNVPGVFPVC